MNSRKEQNSDNIECKHKNVRQDAGYFVCQDCGLILEDYIAFEKSSPTDFYSDSQLDYERKIRMRDSKAIQDPVIKQKYDQIKTLNKWFRDYESSFSEQKKTIELLKSYGIGLNIDQVKYQAIKDRYLKYNKYHRQTYENMVIIFLAIVWLEIKGTTHKRLEEFITVAQELGHKINKKMLNKAMMKVKRTENLLDIQKDKTDLEQEIKNRIKILFQKDLNNIPYENVKQHFSQIEEYNKIKLEMQLKVNIILEKISYLQIQNLNYKAFTAGLIYYIGQTLDNIKIFTQSLVEKTSRFSSTTIRKKFNILKDLLGEPSNFER
ncbi:MAG: TFIIB-type zinc ribbon-containing protein [Candidatus Lokiarchaeota archaeon]|nr:TFIIB-type zinc ribbon-containing protein [Candidatus Lokiarchaeota archaeon]